MQPAVGLVQAYLQLNGYLTVAEFPIMGDGNHNETLTDIDVIGVRFPRACPIGVRDPEEFSPDRILAVSSEGMDVLLCEVKEGKGRFNRNMMRQDVLQAALLRIGCCPPHHLPRHATSLLREGRAEMRHGDRTPCLVRLALFAGRLAPTRPAHLSITLKHAADEVARFMRDHSQQLHAARLTQPALAHFHLLEKVGLHLGT